MKKLLILSLFLSISAFAETLIHQNLPDENATFELCQKSANALNNDELDFRPVISIIEPCWRFGGRQLETIRQESISLTAVGLPIWGNSLHEVVHVDSTKVAKGYFLRHRFLLRRENTGLLFQCIFYKTQQDWQFHTLNWNDEPVLFFIQPPLNPTQ